jgi:hypothetical protein
VRRLPPVKSAAADFHVDRILLLSLALALSLYFSVGALMTFVVFTADRKTEMRGRRGD